MTTTGIQLVVDPVSNSNVYDLVDCFEIDPFADVGPGEYWDAVRDLQEFGEVLIGGGAGQLFHAYRHTPIASAERITLKFTPANYVKMQEWLGDGILICQPGNRYDGKDDYCVLPLPRYRRRTPNGRHAK